MGISRTDWSVLSFHVSQQLAGPAVARDIALLHRLNDVLCKSFERVFASESERVFMEPKTLGMIPDERQDQLCEFERGLRRNELEAIAALLDLAKSRESTRNHGPTL